MLIYLGICNLSLLSRISFLQVWFDLLLSTKCPSLTSIQQNWYHHGHKISVYFLLFFWCSNVLLIVLQISCHMFESFSNLINSFFLPIIELTFHILKINFSSVHLFFVYNLVASVWYHLTPMDILNSDSIIKNFLATLWTLRRWSYPPASPSHVIWEENDKNFRIILQN